MSTESYEDNSYIGELGKYMKRKKSDLEDLNKALYFLSLIEEYKKNNKNIDCLRRIAYNPKAASIKDDAFYILYCVEINRGDVDKTFEIPEIDSALKRITSSELFGKSDEVSTGYKNTLSEGEPIVAEYDKFDKDGNFDSFVYAMEASPLPEETKLLAYSEFALKSCVEASNRKKHHYVAPPIYRQSSNVKEIEEEPIKENEQKSIMEEAQEFFEKYEYLIDADDEEMIQSKIQMRSAVDVLDTPEYESFSIEDRIGILIYSLVTNMLDYKEAENIDDELKTSYEKEIKKHLLIGKNLVARLDKKEQGVK